MDEASNLVSFLPVSFKDPGEQEYISFLWEAFEANYENGKHQFAFLAYHLLMMSFVYFNIWQIRQAQPDDFGRGLIGFARNDETTLLEATSPFVFSRVNERTILRLFRLIGCNDSRIGNYRKLVDDRNDAAHANGYIYYRTQQEIDSKIREVLRAVEEIQTNSVPTVSRCYQEFLILSHNPDGREYPGAEDQIREVLIHGNYMSRKDIEICVNFNLSALGDDNREAITALHNTLCEAYGSV